MARYTIYPETSFWRRLGDSANHDLRKTSYRFLRAVQRRGRLLISKLVLAELSETPDPLERRHVLRRLWSARPRVVTSSRRAERIALDLLEAGGWSDGLFADMLHINYSILSDVDALVTWDRGDLAREHTRRIVQAFGRRQRLPVRTPEEVAGWLGLRI